MLALLDGARGLNALVQDETRRRRLEELRCYHAGIVYREAGQFDLAAQNQEEAAAVALNPDTAAISRFCAAVERAYHAIAGGDPEQVAQRLQQVQEASGAISVLSNATVTNTRWRDADRPAHLLELSFFAGVPYEGWDRDLAALLALPEPLASTYVHWRGTMQAADCLRKGQLCRAIMLADEVLHKGTYSVTNVIALLILARVERAFGLQGIARELLHLVVHYPGHGARIARAVAQRELASLSA